MSFNIFLCTPNCKIRKTLAKKRAKDNVFMPEVDNAYYKDALKYI